MSPVTERNGAARNNAVQADATAQDIYDADMSVRREVLGGPACGPRQRPPRAPLPTITRT